MCITFVVSLSLAGCPDSLIKEVHHFRVLGDEQVGLDSEICRSHAHTPSQQPSLSWSRLMRNPNSSRLSDRHMREALNWPICCSMPFTKPSARNKTSPPYRLASHPCSVKRDPLSGFLHSSLHRHQVFGFEVFTPIGAVMWHLCKAPLGRFLQLLQNTLLWQVASPDICVHLVHLTLSCPVGTVGLWARCHNQMYAGWTLGCFYANTFSIWN